MQSLPIRPNLELKSRPKPHQGSLLFDKALPVLVWEIRTLKKRRNTLKDVIFTSQQAFPISETNWCQNYETFFSHNLRMFVRCSISISICLRQSFQPSLISSGKARDYPSEPPFRFFTLEQAPGYPTQLERLTRDKYSSLLRTLAYTKKFFMTFASGLTFYFKDNSVVY